MMESASSAAVPAARDLRLARVSRLSDEVLARLAGGRGDRAFAMIYERYHQALYRYCRSILRDDTDAQDALQATFLAAFTALRCGRRRAPLRPWLFRIAHNESISLLRRRRDSTQALVGFPESAPSAEDRAGDRAHLESLLGDLAELPERLRGALVMRELNGLSHEEIAIALGVSSGAAKQAIFEARRALMEFAEGRAMDCDAVQRLLSDGDRRTLRGRRVSAHLRDCVACQAFAAAIPARTCELRALAPMLAPPVAAALFEQTAKVVGSSAGGGLGGATVSGAVGKVVAATGASKALVGVAVVATAAAAVGAMSGALHLGHPRAHSSETPRTRQALSSGLVGGGGSQGRLTGVPAAPGSRDAPRRLGRMASPALAQRPTSARNHPHAPASAHPRGAPPGIAVGVSAKSLVHLAPRRAARTIGHQSGRAQGHAPAAPMTHHASPARTAPRHAPVASGSTPSRPAQSHSQAPTGSRSGSS